MAQLQHSGPSLTCFFCSVGVHVLFVMWGWSYVQSEGAAARVSHIDPSVVFDIEPTRSAVVKAMHAQLGVPTTQRDGSVADTLAWSPKLGSVAGIGRAKSASRATVGDDLALLRAAIFNHATRDVLARAQSSRRRRVASVVTRDNARASQKHRSETVALPRQDTAVQAIVTTAVAQTTQPVTTEHWIDDRKDQIGSSTKLQPDLANMAVPTDDGHRTGFGHGAIAQRIGSASGRDSGDPIWLDTDDARYMAYFREVYRKIQPLWRFPKDLALMMEQGDVIVQFTVQSAGTIERIGIRKASGYPSFDGNVLSAIKQAAPFNPVPKVLGDKVTIMARFEFSNPMIQ